MILSRFRSWLSHFSDVEKEPPVSIGGNKWDKEIPRSPATDDPTRQSAGKVELFFLHIVLDVLCGAHPNRRAPAPKEQRRILVGRKVSTGERELEGDKEDKKERT